MFRRTSDALSVEHLFYGVEVIVYCEGDPSDDEGATLDEAFWTRVFLENGLRCKCKSSGSKSELLEIAQKIIDENVENSVVAVDRDYDHLLGKLIDHPKVIYTFGYSWESDLMLEFEIGNAIALFAAVADTNIIQTEFQEFRRNQSSRLRRAFALDVKYFGHRERLFDRSKPVSIIGYGGATVPYIKFDRLLQKAKTFHRFQTVSIPKRVYQNTCGVTSFFGKSVSRLVYRWFIYRSSQIAESRSIPYTAFMSVLIATTNLTDKSIHRNQYYSGKIEAIA